MTTNKDIQSVMYRTIKTIYSNGNVDRQALLSARHASSPTSLQAQAVWPVVLGLLNAEQIGSDASPTREEIAIFSTLHLYSIQQLSAGNAILSMDERTKDHISEQFFEVLNRLKHGPDMENALSNRVQALFKSTNVATIIHLLGQLASIISANEPRAKIDYPKLAADIYSMQWGYTQLNRVKFNWGRQYFKEQASNVPSKTEKEVTTND